MSFRASATSSTQTMDVFMHQSEQHFMRHVGAVCQSATSCATSERPLCHFGGPRHAPRRSSMSESQFGAPSVPLATRRSSPHAGTPPSSGANAASWQTGSRGLTPPSASSAKRRVHWLLRNMRDIISVQRRSCKSSPPRCVRANHLARLKNITY